MTLSLRSTLGEGHHSLRAVADELALSGQLLLSQLLEELQHRYEALAHISAFRAQAGTTPWRGLPRAEVADRLKAIVNDPNTVQQGRLNLCGPAALVRIWAERDPLAFARFATELYNRGEARIGSYKVEPDNDSLIAQDHAALMATHGAEDFGIPGADWMVLGSMRDAENWWYDFEGVPDESIAAGGTAPGELAEWLKATNLYATVRDDTDLVFTQRLDHAKDLHPTATHDIALLINTHLLKTATAISGEKKSDDFIFSAFPNHFVVLLSRIREASGDMVRLTLWTWGQVPTEYEAPKDTFEANYYGAVISERKGPLVS